MNNLLKACPPASFTHLLFQRSLTSLGSSSSSSQRSKLLEPPSSFVVEPSARSLYTFRFPNNRLHKYKRATRPKLSGDNSTKLTYEQTQFAEDLGVTKGWNVWNTCKCRSRRRP